MDSPDDANSTSAEKMEANLMILGNDICRIASTLRADQLQRVKEVIDSLKDYIDKLENRDDVLATQVHPPPQPPIPVTLAHIVRVTQQQAHMARLSEWAEIGPAIKHCLHGDLDMNECNYAQMVDIVKSMANIPTSDLDAVATALRRHCSSPLSALFAAYVWTTHYVDAPDVSIGSTDPVKSLFPAQSISSAEPVESLFPAQSLEIANHFVGKFRDLVEKIAGIQVTVITASGFLHRWQPTADDAIKYNHSWVVAQINSSDSVMIDPRLGAGDLVVESERAVLKRDPKPEFFLMDPRRAIFSHFPNNLPGMQLLSNPVPLAKHLELPHIHPTAFEIGLMPVITPQNVLSTPQETLTTDKDGRLLLNFSLPPSSRERYELRCALTHNACLVPRSTLARYLEDKYSIELQCPTPGFYTLSIDARSIYAQASDVFCPAWTLFIYRPLTKSESIEDESSSLQYVEMLYRESMPATLRGFFAPVVLEPKCYKLKTGVVKFTIKAPRGYVIRVLQNMTTDLGNGFGYFDTIDQLVCLNDGTYDKVVCVNKGELQLAIGRTQARNQDASSTEEELTDSWCFAKYLVDN